MNEMDQKWKKKKNQSLSSKSSLLYGIERFGDIK